MGCGSSMTSVATSDPANGTGAGLDALPPAPSLAPASFTLLSRQSPAEKLERLKNLDCFVLDNTVRETTVGSIRGHVPEDKHRILGLVDQCGFKEYVIAAFGDRRRADDEFVEQLIASGRDLSGAWCFSEFYDSFEEGSVAERVGRRPVLDVPHGLELAVKYGIPNIIIERDIVCRTTAWDRWSEEEEMGMFSRRVEYARDHGLRRVLFNFRDFCTACAENKPWVVRLTRYIAQLALQQAELEILGIIWEEPTGTLFPFELTDWVAEVRAVMDDAGWENGHLLVHIHRGYGMAEATVIECLAAGSTGIWCATCANGAATGHACSAITLTNLARIGNAKVRERFSLPAVRRCAIEVCKIVTGVAPECSTEVYGERALESVFDSSSGMGMGGGGDDPTEVLCEMFEESGRTRISTMATPVMFRKKLVELFGGAENDYDLVLCTEMRSKMFQDLVSGRKEEYNTCVGLSALFERAGGVVTPNMVSRIVRENGFKNHHVVLELKAAWANVLRANDIELGENAKRVKVRRRSLGGGTPSSLPFRLFYDRFMAPYIPCYTCQLADTLFSALDVTADGRLRWDAVEMRACWAIDASEYGDEITSADDLFRVVFQKLLLPLAIERTMLQPDDDATVAAGAEAKLALDGEFKPSESCLAARKLGRRTDNLAQTLADDYAFAVLSSSRAVAEVRRRSRAPGLVEAGGAAQPELQSLNARSRLAMSIRTLKGADNQLAIATRTRKQTASRGAASVPKELSVAPDKVQKTKSREAKDFNVDIRRGPSLITAILKLTSRDGVRNNNGVKTEE